MKLTLSLAATLAMGTMTMFGATLTGTISDSMCGAHHPSGITAKACTNGCVKKGAKYVVVVGDKVYSVSNQDAPGLSKYAGDNVKVTGKVDGDTIMVKKISKV